MKFNDAGMFIIKNFEGCKLKAYPDPGTGGKPYTIGYGSTGPDIGPDTVWTQEQADKRLQDHVDLIDRQVETLIHVPCNDNQFSAMVCLTYNIGIGAFSKSTLLKLFNEGKVDEAKNEFIRWAKAGGKVMGGLLRRREAEAALFSKPVV